MKGTKLAESYAENLAALGIPHVVKYCSASIVVVSPSGRARFEIGENKIEPKYLNFIKKVKQEVIGESTRHNLTHLETGFDYVKFYPLLDMEFLHYDYAEVDINSAYWNAARKFGFISEKIFLEGEKVPKNVRLVALGAAAVSWSVFRFDEKTKKYVFEGEERDEFGRAAFFFIAEHISSVVTEILNEIDFLPTFFWVDALFVPWQVRDFVVDRLCSYGYSSKFYHVPRLEGKRGPDRVEAVVCKSENQNFCAFERKVFFRKRKKTPNFVAQNF